MLLDFITFRWETGDGAAGAVTAISLPRLRGPSWLFTPGLGANRPRASSAITNTKLGKGMYHLRHDTVRIVSWLCRSACVGNVRPDGNADPKPICWACPQSVSRENEEGAACGELCLLSKPTSSSRGRSTRLARTRNEGRPPARHRRHVRPGVRPRRCEPIVRGESEDAVLVLHPFLGRAEHLGRS